MKLTGNKNLTQSLSQKWLNKNQYLDEVGQALVQLARERIEKTKASPEGDKWAPWASSTARARRKEGTAGTGLLLRTGKLRDSIEYEVQGPKVVVRSREQYAQYLQNGTSRMPARPFLGTGPREEKSMQSLWKKWINE